MFSPDRSPYGIRTPSVEPPALPGKPNWMQSLLKYRDVMFPNFARRLALRYQAGAEATTIQGDPSSTYATRLQANFTGGLRSGDLFGIVDPSTDTTYPWPQGTPTGRPRSPYGRDMPPRNSPNGAGYNLGLMRPAPYGQLHSASNMMSQDLKPISGGYRPYSLDFQQPPWRVPLQRKSGLALNAGDQQHGTQQWNAGLGGSIIAGPPSWTDPTRGVRGASGIVGSVQGASRMHVPGVFVPREVR